MKKQILLILTMFYSFYAHSADIKSLFDKASKKLETLLGETTEVKDLITLPPIPVVKKNATSTDVYDKSDPIYTQGEKFNKLNLEQKRKFRIAFLEELYKVVRSEELSNEKLISYLNVLEQDGTREGVYRSLVLDQVYLALESYEEKSTEKLVQFSINFGEEFLKREFSKQALEGLNLWSIKRILVEKSLEVLDAMASDQESIYRWYAVLSENLATTYPQVWKSKLRKSTNRLTHYKWAREVPFQHIKSEVIIKLHRVMNFLQQ